jgi:hypothetical protein
LQAPAGSEAQTLPLLLIEATTRGAPTDFMPSQKTRKPFQVPQREFIASFLFLFLLSFPRVLLPAASISVLCSSAFSACSVGRLFSARWSAAIPLGNLLPLTFWLRFPPPISATLRFTFDAAAGRRSNVRSTGLSTGAPVTHPTEFRSPGTASRFYRRENCRMGELQNDEPVDLGRLRAASPSRSALIALKSADLVAARGI